jgi:hypothetical protein
MQNFDAAPTSARKMMWSIAAPAPQRLRQNNKIIRQKIEFILRHSKSFFIYSKMTFLEKQY